MCVLVSTGARLLPRQLRRLLMMLMLLMMLHLMILHLMMLQLMMLHLMMRQLMMLMLLLPMLLSRAQKRVQTDGPRRYAQSARCRFLRLQPARPALQDRAADRWRQRAAPSRPHRTSPDARRLSAAHGFTCCFCVGEFCPADDAGGPGLRSERPLLLRLRM
jgi:Ca2+/Na+ antiporter